MTGAELLRRLTKVDLTMLTGEAMEKHDQEIVDLNRQQMSQGKDKFSAFIEPPYAFSTVAIKRQKGQEADFVTLEDTGAFKRGMRLEVKAPTYDINSIDRKEGQLVAKYGEEIYGLQEQNKKTTWSIVHDDVVRGIKQQTGLP